MEALALEFKTNYPNIYINLKKINGKCHKNL
jgi:hypothetical protein